ncbi:SDR family mycofactocin-dependent oxidoreductase [Rhodococcus sp. 15-1154-1]|nr:mycofactocin-coupled SDR family oxidoreductase [Rhodococcus sp. 15-1154-1]OZF02520.1 SDR family mycofactocin-dependent oxidoreductase [Rhodococcus sp. 15-1154-1]
MGSLENKVAFITGAARGQGRSHACRLAEEGADIIAIDICTAIEGMEYDGATPADLEQTAKLVESLGRRIVTVQADVRDAQGLKAALDQGVAELGSVDIVCANAGILGSVPVEELTSEQWSTTIDINLTGVWNTVSAAIPHLISQGTGGSIVITSSTAGLRGLGNLAHYSAAKHGVVGLARSLARELGPHNVRVNTVHPTAILTDMVANKSIFRRFRPDLADPGVDDVADLFEEMNLLPVPFVEARDISNAIAWLSSDQARYVTGAAIPVDAGNTQK